MDNASDVIRQQYLLALEGWLDSCKRGGKLSRNTIAVGLVVLDHLRKNGPITRESVISPGGEIKGARSGLGDILEKYGIPRNYLKEATTRQAHQDGQRLFDLLEWGEKLQLVPENEREGLILLVAQLLINSAHGWLKRQNLKLDIDRRQAPTAWVNFIIENAKSRSGGIVEQHLIGAKLERRFKDISVSNHPAHAADIQTARDGDFTISNNIYHVTASPGRSVIQKCASNIRAGKFPILLVPGEQEVKAKAIADDEGIGKELAILSIESFIALNIIELALDEQKDYFTILQEIVEVYNRRLGEVETDLSLQIDVK